MTLGKLALRSLTLSVLSACILIAASGPQLRFYEELEAQASELIKNASKVNPVIVNDTDIKSYPVPPGPAVKLLVRSDLGKSLQMLYLRHRVLRVIDHIGEGNKVVRRDLYHEELVRVQQFFDQENNLTQDNFLDTNGKVLHRKELPVAPPPPGWVY